MRRNFKPYNKRKPFKRKSGGSKFFLGGKSKFEFPANMRMKEPSEGLLNLIAMIMGGRQRQIVRTSNK